MLGDISGDSHLCRLQQQTNKTKTEEEEEQEEEEQQQQQMNAMLGQFG